MRNLKFIIAGLVLGLLASCSADNMEDDCGCISRTVSTSSFTMVNGDNNATIVNGSLTSGNNSGGTTSFSKTVYGSWTPSCGTTGIKDGPGNVKIETKCN